MRIGFWLCLSMILSILLVDVGPVYACSGGAPRTISGYFDGADYVVEVQVVEVDDLKQNMIVRAVRYFGEAGPEFLLIVRNDVSGIDYQMAGLSSSGDCLSIRREMSPGTRFYVAVLRTSDGSYRMLQTLFNDEVFQFESSQDTVEVFIEGAEDDDTYATPGTGIQVTESQFLGLLIDIGGEPQSPNSNVLYPLKASLLIYTDHDDSPYLLPIDSGIVRPMTWPSSSIPGQFVHFPPACFEEDCSYDSPDNLSTASRVNTDTIIFTDLDQVTGQGLVFSATSEAVAVWNHCELTIYTTGHPRLGRERYRVEPINTTSITGESQCLDWHEQAVWSPDGRYLAYVDQQGIWLWDVYANIDPILLYDGVDENSLTARYFSPLGRYLAVSEAAEHFTVDVRTSNRLPDGIVSPDDRLLIQFDTSLVSAPVEICSLTPLDCETIGPIYIERYSDDGAREQFLSTRDISEAMWISPAMFVTRTCFVDSPRECVINQWGPPQAYFGWNTNTELGYGFSFDYDVSNGEIAIVNNDHSITVRGRTLDLSEQINGTIQRVEWSRSLFYHR